VILYAVFAAYFAGVMVRLMLTLTPVVCVLGGITFSHTISKFVKVFFTCNNFFEFGINRVLIHI